jgi:hypothetical protein
LMLFGSLRDFIRDFRAGGPDRQPLFCKVQKIADDHISDN